MARTNKSGGVAIQAAVALASAAVASSIFAKQKQNKDEDETPSNANKKMIHHDGSCWEQSRIANGATSRNVLPILPPHIISSLLDHRQYYDWSSSFNKQTCQCESSSSSPTTTTTTNKNNDTAILDGFNTTYTDDPDDNHHTNNKRRALNIQRSRTLRILTSKAKQNTLSSLYTIDWDEPPIGEGAFGHVLLATNNATGERVALKYVHE